jgi:PKD repeat protein
MLKIGKTLTTFSFLLTAHLTFSQDMVFTGQNLRNSGMPELDSQFHAYTIYQIDALQIDNYSRSFSANIEFTLNLGDYEWRISLQPHDLRSNDYKLTALTERGEIELPKARNITFQGKLQDVDDSKISLTIFENVLYGFIRNQRETYFIEPLSYFKPGSPEDQFVVYAVSDVKPTEYSCGAMEMKFHRPSNQVQNHGAERALGKCYVIQLAIASDRSMFTKYGSVSAVEAHNLGVMNNVAANYDNEFNDVITFSVTQNYVVTNSSDPWSSSSDAATLLQNFSIWAPTGFSAAHDLGQLWTNIDFNNSTIGIAWLEALCTNWGYHCLQDWTTNANLLRVMTAHEIGHNLSADHDPSSSNTIMAPTVTNTSAWSAVSIQAINAHIAATASACLSECSGGGGGGGGGGTAPISDFSASPTQGCGQTQVTFTNLSSSDATSWSWSFPGGSPSSSTDMNPVVLYSSVGTYSVSLTATNAFGSNTKTKTNYITISGVPNANFSYSINGRTVSFNNTSSNSTSYSWNFGDGNTSNSTNPVHTYSNDGTYNIVLTAMNNCGNSNSSLNISIQLNPVADFTASPTEGCAPLSVSFVNQSSSNSTSWQWTFQGGTPNSSTTKNPVVSFSSPGNYSVTLTATNSNGSHTVTKSNLIVVNRNPGANFSYSLSGRTVTFTNTSTNTSSYSWNFGDGGSSSQLNPVHTFAADGNYTVQLTAMGTCGSSTISGNILIAASPIANFSAGTRSGCTPLQVSFSNQSSNSTSWQWSFPGGTPSTSTSQNPIVQYNTPGIYAVSLTATNNFGSNTTSKSSYISVNGVPATDFEFSSNGLTATFSNTSTNAVSYSWSFGDGKTSTAKNPANIYPSDGIYQVSLTATNNCGSAGKSKNITIITNPVAGFLASPTQGCGPLQVAFTNQSSANSSNWEWSFPGGNPAFSTEKNPVVKYPNPGLFSVTLKALNAAGNDIITKQQLIQVNGNPVTSFSFTITGRTIALTNTSANANSFSWNFGDGKSSQLTSPVHTYNADGKYNVNLTAFNECGSSSFSASVTISTPPLADFTAAPQSGCPSLTVNFTNLSSPNATSWEWSFPGGSPAFSTLQNPTVVYQNAGNYEVNLVAKNSAGNHSITKSNVILVNPLPTPLFSASANGNQVALTNNSANATSYLWSFGEGIPISSEQNPVVTFPKDGEYEIKLTAGNNCGTAFLSRKVSIVTPPIADFEANVKEGCAPLSVQFINKSSVYATNYLWSFPGGTPGTSTEANPVVVYQTPGVFEVSLTVTNSAGSAHKSKQNFIVTQGKPVVSFDASIEGAVVTFNNKTSGAFTYLWNFGNGAAESSSPNPTYAYFKDGTYKVQLKAFNNCGSTLLEKQITILTPPVAGFTSKQTIGCAPFSVEFMNESSENTTQFQWAFPGGVPDKSAEANPKVVYKNPGVYEVSLMASNAAGSNQFIRKEFIVVESMPVAGFKHELQDAKATFINTSLNSTNYLWSFGDGNRDTVPNPVYQFRIDGEFRVVLQTTNNCGSSEYAKSITVLTAPVAKFSSNKSAGCQPLAVQFVNESSTNATSFQWHFPGGKPFSSTEHNPVVTYDSAGVFSVQLIAKNAKYNDTLHYPAYIAIGKKPSPAITVVTDKAKASFSIAPEQGTLYKWNLGDGTKATGHNIQHTYKSNGRYQVMVEAQNGCGTSSASAIIDILFELPKAAFIVNQHTGCAPFSTVFNNASSTNSKSFEWLFPGGNPSTSNATDQTVVYEQSGTYDVILIARNESGNDTLHLRNYIQAKPAPTAAFDFTLNNDEVVFSNKSVNALSYFWKFGNELNSNVPNPRVQLTKQVPLEVSLTAFNECGQHTALKTISLNSTDAAGRNVLEYFHIYPNPNSGNFSIELSGNPKPSLSIGIFNALGKRIFTDRLDFSRGRLERQFSLQDIPSGIYLIMVSADKHAVYKKLIIE